MKTFDEWVDEANTQGFSGWDFSYLRGRFTAGKLPWDYRAAVQDALPFAHSLLDMGTGGGEFLASLAGLPKRTFATEAYEPNIPVATSRLEPLGIHVAGIADDTNLPFADEQFDLVTNRHESYDVRELFRIMRPGARFLTQQVGGQNERVLNEALGAPLNQEFLHWDLDYAVRELEQAGFSVVQREEAFSETKFYDIGAVVFYLQVVEWQIPGFSVQHFRPQLEALHEDILRKGCFSVHAHRFFLEAQKLS